MTPRPTKPDRFERMAQSLCGTHTTSTDPKFVCPDCRIIANTLRRVDKAADKRGYRRGLGAELNPKYLKDLLESGIVPYGYRPKSRKRRN